MITKGGYVEIRGASGLDCIKVNQNCEDEAASFAPWIRLDGEEMQACTSDQVILSLEDTGVQLDLWCSGSNHLQ